MIVPDRYGVVGRRCDVTGEKEGGQHWLVLEALDTPLYGLVYVVKNDESGKLITAGLPNDIGRRCDVSGEPPGRRWMIVDVLPTSTGVVYLVKHETGRLQRAAFPGKGNAMGGLPQISNLSEERAEISNLSAESSQLSNIS